MERVTDVNNKRVKLSKKDRWLIRQLAVIFTLATISAIAFIILNELIFINRLGWHSMAFPIIVIAAVLLGNAVDSILRGKNEAIQSKSEGV